MTTKFNCDVLVIGAGGAGMRAAIAAGESGSKVIVACKSLLGKAHTVMAEGGIAAGLGNVDNPDNWETHFADTIRGGKYLNNWRMVELYAHEVIDRVYELEQWGGLFDRTPDGLISQRPFGGHTYRRLCHVGDRTGLELIRTLQDKLVHTEGVEVLMEYTVIKLLKNGDRVVGAFGYSRNDGEAVVINAKATILATGGWGKMYQTTSNSWESTGDGASLAYEAGADLLDMEFVQFHPTGMVWPPGARGILVTEAVRGEGGILLNNKGERFMEQYDPKKMELSTRDVVARSIYKEVQAGRGSEHGGALLDIHHKGADYILKKLPSMHEQFWSLASVDITKEPMEVYPTIHYTMGGVKVEPETAATTVAGLYAAGESAGGLHGGNRLGGNSLGDILVFGKRSGDAAAEFAKVAPPVEVDETQVKEAEAWLEAPLKRNDGENPFKMHAELQAAMQDDAGISRTQESLQRSLDKVLELKKRTENLAVDGDRKLNPGWHACFDMQSMLTVSEAIVRAAMERRESRASHWRLDFPDLSEEEGKKNYLVRKNGAEMKVESVAHEFMPERLAVLMEEK